MTSRLYKFFVCMLVLSASPVVAEDNDNARELLERAAEAMGGLDVLQGVDNFIYTGFGQRYSTNGNISADLRSPPKWQSVTDAQRSFDLSGERALNQERTSYMFPFAIPLGHSWNRSNTLQTGWRMMDHPLPALLEALDPETVLGPVSIEDGRPVVQFTIEDGSPIWIGLDPQTHLPYFTRWITGSATLGDVTNTAYFTGYLPFEGVMLPIGLMNEMDWRDQTTLMFQVDSYRLNIDDMPEFPEAAPSAVPAAPAAPEVEITEVADGVWHTLLPGFFGPSGGAVIEFEDHLVMFEPYGSEAQVFARIDAANQLVPGKEVTAIIVTHHHDDHAAGVRAAVSRGIAIIAQARNQALYEEWVSRPAVYFPDALARNPQPMDFIPVDEQLVLEDATQRLEIYQVVGNFHMSDAVLAYLPQERILMEGDFSEDSWTWNWWANSLRANMDHYDLDAEIVLPVHGVEATVEEKLAEAQDLAEAAQAFCDAQREAEIYSFFGCPVRYDSEGPILP